MRGSSIWEIGFFFQPELHSGDDCLKQNSRPGSEGDTIMVSYMYIT